MEQKQICSRFPPLSTKYPWLVAQNLEDDNTGDQIFYPLHNPLSKYRCRIPELTEKYIQGYFHGWLILSDTTTTTTTMWSLWNPLTSKIIHLPPLILKDGECQPIRECCLSSPPYTPGSILLLSRTENLTFVYCRLDSKKESFKWAQVPYAKQLKRITGNGRLLYNLTCCNGKVYALNADSIFAKFVIRVDIMVKDKDVEINLLLFGACPFPPYNEVVRTTHFLKGSDTELFCIIVGFKERTCEALSFVSLFKLDMTSINWEDLECLKHWDLTDTVVSKSEPPRDEDLDDLDITGDMWEETFDLKNNIFFVDLARDYSIFYTPTFASEIGGYIHIRSRMGNIIYSYNLNDKSISLSSMPSPVLPTSHVSVWECRFEDDHGQAKCTNDSKQEEDKDREVVVSSITDDEVEQPHESHLLNLPLDVLEMIIKCCVGVEYMKFRATCTRCHLVAPSIRWRDETPLSKLQTYSLVSPWLMVLDQKQGIITFTDPMFGDKYFMKNLRVSIVDGGICCSRYGWLLFHSNLGLVFYNPFTGDIRELPDLDVFFVTLSFSAPPTSPDCMVVGYGRGGVYLHHVAREPSWRSLGIDFNGDGVYPFNFPTFHGRDLYYLFNTTKRLHVIKNVGGENYRQGVEDVADAPRSCASSSYHFLVKCDQHLLLVTMGQFGESVEVFKLNDLTKEWEKVDDLGRHMIYISERTCLCIEAQTREMENKIYFPRLHSRTKKVVFYSLKTRMYHTFSGKNVEDHSRDLVGTIHHPFYPHAWIEPSWC